jgi:alkyl hydroperoxide reductase subunit AhpC
MLTVGDKVPPFFVTGVAPGALTDKENGNLNITVLSEKSFPGKWKIVVFYPQDWTFVCPTEIIDYDNFVEEFEKRNAVLMVGSTDNEYSKLSWRNHHEGLKKTRHWSFADKIRANPDKPLEGQMRGLGDVLGVINQFGVAWRATFIVDPSNMIQHVTVNGLSVGRNASETLRVLDAIQTQKFCACNRPVGGETLN